MKQNYVKQALLALAFCATMPTFAIEFPSIGEAPQNGKTYMLLSRSNPTNFMTRTSWDGAFYLLPYNKEDIKKAVIKAVKNDNGTWSFTHDEVTLEEDSSEVITTYYVGIPSGTDNLNVNFSEPVEWTIENGDYTGFYKLQAGEGQGNELTIGGYLHLNAGNQYAIINESSNRFFPDYFGGVQTDEEGTPKTDEEGYLPIPLNTISQNWAFVDATLDLTVYRQKIQLFQILQDIEDNNLKDEAYKAGFQNAIDAALTYYQKADFTEEDLAAAKDLIAPYTNLYAEIAAAKELLGENTDATFEKAIADATAAFNTKDADLTAALETLKTAEEAYAKSSGDLTILGQNMSFEDLSSQDGNQTSGVAAPPTGWNVFINGKQVTTADEVRAAGISAWHGINNDSEGETKDGEMSFGLWNGGVPEYELSQTISNLENGFYQINAALMVGANGGGSRRTTQRIFGNLNSTYFANEYDYNVERLDQSEVYTFAGLDEPVTDREMKEMSVLAFVYDGTLTFGVRTNGDYQAANRESSNGAGGDGWFKVDNFRLYKVDYSADDAIIIYQHFADLLEAQTNRKMESTIADEANNAWNANKITDKSTQDELIAAILTLKDMYAKAKASADIYEDFAAAISKAEENLMEYSNSASADDFSDQLMGIRDAYEEGTANTEQVKAYIQQIEEGIDLLKNTAIAVGDITFALKNPSFEDLGNQNNLPSDGAVKAPKGWTLYVDGAEAETVTGGWCAINHGDNISVTLEDGSVVEHQYTDGEYLWGIWNSNIPEVQLSQTLKNMPPGTYTLTADVMVEHNWAGDCTTTQRIFGNNCVQMWGTPEAYSELNLPADAVNAAELTYAGHVCAKDLEGAANCKLLHPMQVTFGVGPDSTLTIGFRTNGVNFDGKTYADGGLNGQGWFKVDNFRLSYDSEDIPTCIKSISEINTIKSEIYGLDGTRRNALRRGLNIVRMPQSDGSMKSKKIIFK